MTLQVAFTSIAVRRGLFFGAFIAGCVVVEAVIAYAISVGALGVTPASFGSAFQYNLLTQGLLGGAVSLTTFVLLICAGASAYKRARRIGAGAIAGLVAGALGGLVGALVSVILIFVAFATAPAPSASAQLSGTLATSGTTIALGLAFECAEGAGLGALGALIRQSIFN